jgi:hypothetical protein
MDGSACGLAVAGFARPGFGPGLQADDGDDEGGEGVGAPEAEHGVSGQAMRTWCRGSG